MGKRFNQQRFVAYNLSSTPLGQVKLSAFLDNSRGVPDRPMRVLGSYALILLLNGTGVYRDGNGYRCRVRAGDAILVFPHLAHWYGPTGHNEWNEFYVIFEGPIFDLLHSRGILDESRPVQHYEPATDWLQKLLDVLQIPHSPASPEQMTLQVGRLANAVAEFALHGAQGGAKADGRPQWLSAALLLLENLSWQLDKEQMEHQVGMSYDMFRKRFQQHTGLSPRRYQEERRMEAACTMLRHGVIASKEIARSLGFSDEFHFSKRFKQLMHVTPRQYRQNVLRANGQSSVSE